MTSLTVLHLEKPQWIMFLEKTVSECTDVLQQVILPAKEIAYHKQKGAENPSSDQDLS